MKILVTGIAGFIGSNLAKRLLKEGCKVVGIDNYSTGTRDNHIEGVEYIEMDIRDISKLDREFDICFHTAALSRVQPSFVSPLETFDVNVRGTLEVLEYCRNKNIHVIYSGSSSKHYNHDLSPYAKSKYVGEELCKLYREVYGMYVEITRYYNVYGPNEIIDHDFAAVVGIFRRQKRDGVPLTIVGDGKQVRDYTHVDDVVDAVWRLSISNKTHKDAWEIGTNEPISVLELASYFDHPVEFIPEQKGNYRSSQRVNSDAIDRLGWKPTNRLKEYVLQVN